MSEATDVKTRLAAARAAKEKRDAEAKAAADARELEVLELEEKLESMYGPRGQAFEIVETIDGPIAVKLGEAVLHTRFQASKVSDTDINDYVFPCVVHPPRETYLALVAKRPGLGLRCASALATLFGAKDARDAGKF